MNKVSPIERVLNWANRKVRTLNTKYIFRIGKKYLAISWNGKNWDIKTQP